PLAASLTETGTGNASPLLCKTAPLSGCFDLRCRNVEAIQGCGDDAAQSRPQFSYHNTQKLDLLFVVIGWSCHAVPRKIPNSWQFWASVDGKVGVGYVPEETKNAGRMDRNLRVGGVAGRCLVRRLRRVDQPLRRRCSPRMGVGPGGSRPRIWIAGGRRPDG